MEAAHLQDARQRRFFRVLGQFDLVLPRGAGVAQRGEFIDTAQRRLARGRDQVRSHAPDVDRRPLRLQVGNRLLVQVVAADDHGVGETGRVENAAGFDAQAGDVARIEPDADQVVAALAQPRADLHGFAHPFQAVVGIDQKHAVVGHGLGIRLKRLQLVPERHDPTVRVGAAHRNAEQLAGQHVGRGRAAADVRRAAGGQRAVDALCAAQAEFQHRVAVRCQTHARGLRGDQGLKIDQIQQRGLDDLALQDRPLHAHQRLLRKHDRSLGNGVHPAGQFEGVEVVEKGGIEQRPPVRAAQLGQIGHVPGVEPEVGQEVERIAQAARDAEPALKRVLTKEEMKDGFLVRDLRLPIPVRHRELIQVGQ